MKVLYIDGVGPFGGASRSLFETISALKQLENVSAHFVAVRGTVVPYYSSLADGIIVGIGLTRFDNTLYSHYRGLRWLVVLRELFHVPSTIRTILHAKLKWNDIDLIHVNEITEVIPMLFARLLFKVPIVVHVRSVTWRDPSSLRCRWLESVLRTKVDAIIAIDDTVRESLPGNIDVNVVHNSFTPKYSLNKDNRFVDKLSTIGKDSFNIGFVGNLLVSKGLFDLLDAANLICGKHPNVHFLIVGDVTRNDKGLKSWLLNKLGFAQDIKTKLEDRIKEYGLTDNFHLLGATDDIQRAYESFDVICFPSHFDAPGRPIFEAAFSGVSCIAAINDPKSDTLIQYETGIAVPPKRPDKIAEAILYFVNNPHESKRMGNNARELAKNNFTPSTNAMKLLDVYKRCLDVKKK